MNLTSSPHSVTMSALAASTATVSGVFSSMSAAFWFAPLFRNKHTCLKRREGNISVDCGDLKKKKQKKTKQTTHCIYHGRLDKPSVAQHGGVVEGSSALSVLLVHTGGILQQELAGDQWPLDSNINAPQLLSHTNNTSATTYIWEHT